MNNEEEKKEEVKEENTQKKNTGLIITIVVLCLLVAVLGILLLVVVLGPKMNESNKSNKNKPTITDKIEEDEEETTTLEEVNDDLKLVLFNKINTLFGCKESDTFQESNSYGLYGFNVNFLKEDLSDKDKQVIVLEAMTFEDIEYSKWESAPKVKEAIEKDEEHLKNARNEYKYLPYDKVDNYYKNLFGKSIGTPKEVVGKCPNFYYSKETNEFYRFRPACGGASSGLIMTYFSNFTKKSDSVVVDMSVGVITNVNDNDFEVYSDFNYNKESQSINGGKTLITTQEGKDYTINKDNYEQFSQYKITFKKNGENYYFSSIKQVK